MDMLVKNQLDIYIFFYKYFIVIALNFPFFHDVRYLEKILLVFWDWRLIHPFEPRISPW